MAESERSKAVWLLAPPEPGQIHFHFEAGEGVTLTPEVEAALNQLSRELIKQQSMVQGFTGSEPNICHDKCMKHSVGTCFRWEQCQICSIK